jgi:hypothetical protein
VAPAFARPAAAISALARCVQTSFLLSRWGWPGAGGLLLLAATAAVHFFALPALQAQASSLQTTLKNVDLQRQRLALKRVDGPAQTTPVERFAALFPEASLREERIAELLKAAKTHGLEARRGEFRLVREADLNLLKYSATLPLRGSYANVRAFIEDVQRNDNALSLDRLRLQRGSAAGGGGVEAETNWTFYMRAPPLPASSSRLPTAPPDPQP